MAIQQLQMHMLVSMEGTTRFMSGHHIVISIGGRDLA